MRYTVYLVDGASLPASAARSTVIPADYDQTGAPMIAWRSESGEWIRSNDPDAPSIKARALDEAADLSVELEQDEDDLGVVIVKGERASLSLLDPELLTEIQELYKKTMLLAGVPTRDRLLLGGVTGGLDGFKAFMARVRAEHDAAPASDRVSPKTMFCRNGTVNGMMNPMILAALAKAGRD